MIVNQSMTQVHKYTHTHTHEPATRETEHLAHVTLVLIRLNIFKT